MDRNAARLAGLILTALCLAGCATVGGLDNLGQSNVPAHFKDIYIPEFTSDLAPLPGLDLDPVMARTELTAAVRQAFNNDGRLPVTTDLETATCRLDTRLAYFNRQPLTRNPDNPGQSTRDSAGNYVRFRLLARVDLTFTDLTEKKELWKHPGLEAFVDYNTRSFGGEPIKTDIQALREVAQQLADRIASRVLEGWASAGRGTGGL